LPAAIAYPLLAKPEASCLESLHRQKAAIESRQSKSNIAADRNVKAPPLRTIYRYQAAQSAKGAGCLAALTLADEGAESERNDQTRMLNQCCNLNTATKETF
jgi:hypothetical protein